MHRDELLQLLDRHRPTSVAEAVSLLAKGNGTVGILAGGTDLIAQLKEGRRKLDLLLDVKKIPEATELSFDSATGLKIGAAVSCSDIYGHPDVQKHYPALIDCTSLIGSVQIQNRASVGGNFCNSSPAADTPPAVIAPTSIPALSLWAWFLLSILLVGVATIVLKRI